MIGMSVLSGLKRECSKCEKGGHSRNVNPFFGRLLLSSFEISIFTNIKL